MLRQSYQARSTTLKSCMTKLKSSGVRFWNSHLNKFTLNRKGALFTLSSHPNTSLCIQAIRLPAEIQQVHSEHNSQCISGQLHNTSGWTKVRYRVKTASSDRQAESLRETCWLHCPCMVLQVPPDDNRQKSPGGLLLGVAATGKTESRTKY